MSEPPSNPGKKPKTALEKLQKFIGFFKYRTDTAESKSEKSAALDAIADKFDIGKDYPEFKGWELIGFHRGLGREFWQLATEMIALALNRLPDAGKRIDYQTPAIDCKILLIFSPLIIV
jgi:hypothetical protein